ncbi:transposase [Sporolactobacillus sp. Y61]|uniref:Transposase n=1 Tax=Sporolactobacillus sp. Y61 TaxID=3160863 RepID=A0AAU8II93_9BACL
MEYLNEEFRRRERVIRLLPNRDPVTRLMVSVLMKTNEKWLEGRRYLDMTDYGEWRAQQLLASKILFRLS